MIEALLCWQESRLIAEVPLSDALRGVSERLQTVGDGVFLGMQAVLRSGWVNPGYRNPGAIATGHDLRP